MGTASRTAIIVAVIGSVGVIGAALIGNWDKFGSRSLFQGQSACDLNGDWRCADKCSCKQGFEGKTARIAHDGIKLTLWNEWGDRTTGEVTGDHAFRAYGWDTGATITSDCRKITFDNGTLWDR
jgi:hypothetical protein